MFDRAAKPVKFGAKLVLLLGFGGVLGLMSLAGFNSVQVLRRIEASNTRITQGYLERHHFLDQIRSSLYLSATAVRDYLLDPNAAVGDEHLENLKTLRGRTESALRSYAASALPHEARLVAELGPDLTEYWKVLSPVLQWSEEEKRAKGNAFFEKEVVPRRLTILRIADRIEAINEEAVKEGNRRSVELFQSFRRQVVVILAITLGLGIALAAFSITYMLRLEKDARVRYQEIVRARTELQRLSARLVQAQEDERRSISRELHDEIGQSLSAMLVDLGNLVAVTPPGNEAAHRLLGTAKKLAEESLNAVRNMSLLLRPSMLDDFGLIPALRWQTREVSRRTGMFVDLAAEETADELPDEYRSCVYRVVQEALHNCSRHAAANTVHIAVRQDAARLLLTIQDDGSGFDARNARGLGLLGIEERVKHLGGAFEVDSEPGRGTLLRVELPLPAPEAHPVEIKV